MIFNFPAYRFTDGILQGVEHPIPALRPDEIGYYGAQLHVHPPGEGDTGTIEVIRALPLADRQGDVQILSLHQNGGILILVNGKQIFLAVGASVLIKDRDETAIPGDLIPGPRHVTEHLINHGFLPLDKVRTQ